MEGCSCMSPCQVRTYWEHDLRAGSYSRVTPCRPLSMLIVVSLAWVIRVGLVPLPLLLTGGAIGGMVLLVSRTLCVAPHLTIVTLRSRYSILLPPPRFGSNPWGPSTTRPVNLRTADRSSYSGTDHVPGKQRISTTSNHCSFRSLVRASSGRVLPHSGGTPQPTRHDPVPGSRAISTEAC